MAAAAVKAPSFGDGGHVPGYISPLSYGNNNSSSIPNTAVLNSKLGIFSSSKTLNYDEAPQNPPLSPRSSTSKISSVSGSQYKLKPTLRNLDTKMGSRTMTAPLSTTTSSARRADSRLHKRASSGSSVPTSPAVLAAAHAQLTTPVSPYEEPFPDITPTTSSSTPKIKPYLRKISTGTGKDDVAQGRLDLSKSVSNENGALAGLGIEDFGVRSVSDGVVGVVGGRTISHARNTSVGSQASTGSGSFRPTASLPFVHPMRPTPTRPYTPPIPAGDVSALDEEEAHESSDVVPEEDMLQMQRTSRSMSVSSTPQILPGTVAPTPLSQSHTVSDLGQVPKLTQANAITNASQTNLSIRSGKSLKSQKSKLSRPRAGTNPNPSVEILPGSTPTPRTSSRTSLDRAISYVSRRSDPDPSTRDERIRAARRKFEMKEADKDRKMEQQQFKRRESDLAKSAKKQERQRRKSEASVNEKEREKPKIGSSMSAKTMKKEKSQADMKARRYEEGDITALPTHGVQPGMSEKQEGLIGDVPARSRSGGWSRFSSWFQTRALSCGRKRS